MKMSKNECVELYISDLYHTFSELSFLVSDLADTLNNAIDIIYEINNTIEEAAFTAPALENSSVQWEDISKILDFIELYGKNSKYENEINANEKIAYAMTKIAQSKILADD